MKVLKLTPNQALNGKSMEEGQGIENVLFIKDVNKDLNLELHFAENKDVMSIIETTKGINSSLKSYETQLKEEKVNSTVIKKRLLDRKKQLINDLKDEHGQTGVDLVNELMLKGSQKFIGGVAIERTSLIVTVIGNERNYKITKELLGLDGSATEKETELLLNETTTRDFLKTEEIEENPTVKYNKFLQEFITDANSKLLSVRGEGKFYEHMKENFDILISTKDANNKFLCSKVARYLAEKQLIEKK